MPGVIALTANHQHDKINLRAAKIHRLFQRSEKRNTGVGAVDHRVRKRDTVAYDRTAKLFALKYSVQHGALTERRVPCKTFA